MKTILLAVLNLGVIGSISAAAPYYNVGDYGAKGDGTSPVTAAIQKAVDACAAGGGGKVLIPPGHYVTGPIFLQSRVEVELASGAVLLGSTNLSDYPAIDGRWEGVERKVYASIFTGHRLEHVSITGRGTIDGRGPVWWEAQRKTAILRRQKGIVGREPENPPDAPLHWPRPRMINLYNCTNVLIRDLTLLNSPSWNVHPVYCENVTIDNLTIIAPPDSPNTDAVDPDSCRNVRISNGFFDVGDDCIVIKSGYNEDGRRVGIPCEDVLVSNCTFGHGHGGVVIGSEMSGSVRNVTVANCIFDGTQRGLRVKTSVGRGGVIENFRASNLVMRNITDAAFSVTAAYDREAKESTGKPAPETIPIMRRIHWSDIIVAGVNKIADISSLQESPLEDFSLRNIQVTAARSGIRCSHAKGVVLDGLNLEVASGPAVEVQNVAGLDLLRLVIPKPNAGSPVISFKSVSQALVRDGKVAAGPGIFVRADKDSKEVTSESNRLAPGVKEREP
jgi:Glycosyl hydrolases family 28